MIRLPPDFNEFLRLLNSTGVEYMLVGGYAVAFHGHPRATGDIDIWIRRTPQNVDRVVTALREFGFSTASAELFRRPDALVRMGVPPVRIELHLEISGVIFDEAFPRTVDGVIDDIPVRVIHVDDLRKNKRAAGRAKDREDLEALGE